jgi:hypothetical protein
VLVEKTLSLTGSFTITRSLRSVFEFVSAGALLPGGFGLPDPCSEDTEDLSSVMSDHCRDEITQNAQETLRKIAFGHWEAVFK